MGPTWERVVPCGRRLARQTGGGGRWGLEAAPASGRLGASSRRAHNRFRLDLRPARHTGHGS